MSKTSIDRLRDYLAQLPSQSQALLMREYERAIARGEDVKVANFVLDQLRGVVRGSPDAVRARVEDPTRLIFKSIEPFLIEGTAAGRPGEIRRASLLPIWQWLERDAVDAVQAFEAVMQAQPEPTASEIERAVRKFQQAAAALITQVTTPGPNGRGTARIGPPHAVEDLPALGAVLRAREALDAFAAKLPSLLRTFTDSQSASVNGALNVPVLVTPQVLPFSLSLVMQRMASPWQIIRLAVKIAASDDEIRVAATPYGVAVTMALAELTRVAHQLRTDIRRGKFDTAPELLKTAHDGVRGLRTELDMRNDSVWGRQMAAIRVEISSTLQSEIESVPGRVRRLLRQRADKDISPTARIDPADVDETVALINFVAVCRTYASELAINEVTLRTYSDLQQYVEKSTEALVQSLRAGEARIRAYRQAQAKAAIRFCELLFGAEYAALMSRAADNAMAVVERKPKKTG
ncbi:hypothetical protein FNL55_11490 [Tardiphaga sp. vice352]|uniref:hypothetical protein n=1 Tax=unclassified Tardiphaga TaxID=2631404 RepID=UPI0011629849|nr:MULTISPECIES: hypothetical protein [unclassified Tardiphaga]QDM16595.1 hypothetical protein FNL53_12200 [Tardiphaga sp. vice278]QDM21619.1 hypothetical protein FIU28_11075 [Tardiphaga sp. vice154]QDM26805.1 hypothetical protein FNL56_12350 [Tardiphaga sp. vice304]QDM31868.1 hypothetical protein FNL55_11490 [Tardiphaga sp. vice352]